MGVSFLGCPQPSRGAGERAGLITTGEVLVLGLAYFRREFAQSFIYSSILRSLNTWSLLVGIRKLVYAPGVPRGTP